MAFKNLKGLAAKIKEAGVNQAEAKAGGGGEYTPPAEGTAMLRFVGYVELGNQAHTYKGKTSYKPKVQLTFELHGKKWPYNELDDGTKVPQRITIKETQSQSQKAHFFKIFNAMRDGREEITHYTEMLGDAFCGRIVHDIAEAKGDLPERVFARLRDDNGYTIRGPWVEAPDDDGDIVKRKVKVPEALSELRCFVWDFADKEMWDSLYIDGEYEDTGKTKNVLQEMILNAENFAGSPIDALLAKGNGGKGKVKRKPEPVDDDEALSGADEDEVEEEDETPPTPPKKSTKPAAAKTTEKAAAKTNRKAPAKKTKAAEPSDDDDLLEGVE